MGNKAVWNEIWTELRVLEGWNLAAPKFQMRVSVLLDELRVATHESS
jgi:hypothetical protein